MQEKLLCAVCFSPEVAGRSPAPCSAGQLHRGNNTGSDTAKSTGCSQDNWVKLPPQRGECSLDHSAPVECRVTLVSGWGAWQKGHFKQ